LPPKGSALGDFFLTLFEAGGRSKQGFCVLAGGGCLAWGTILTVCSYFVPSTGADATVRLVTKVKGPLKGFDSKKHITAILLFTRLCSQLCSQDY
jgi:hypothetical protein